MKVFLLALFVAAAVAAPLEEDIGEPVELIVNGVADGEPLELGDVLDIKVKEHVDGQIASSTDLLHPLTAAGLAEAAAINPEAPLEDIQVLPEVVEVQPEPVVLPQPVLPEVVPEPVILPQPVLPEVNPEPVVLPQPVLPGVQPEPVIIPEPVLPEVVPEPIVMPDAAAPEVVPEPIVMPEAAVPEIVPEPILVPEAVPVETPDLVLAEPAESAPQVPTGEVYNDGVVQVTVNAPEPGVVSTIQSWFNMVLNYFNNGVQTSHQIV